MSSLLPSGWSQTNQALTRSVPCADFVEALAYAVEVGRVAEKADHHPDIDIRYRSVNLRLTTHSADHTVTEKDFALAQHINDLSEPAILALKAELTQRFRASLLIP